MTNTAQTQAAAQGAAEQQPPGRGALPQAYPRTAEGLRRLEADIQELKPEALGARYGVSHHAVLKYRTRLRKALATALPAEPQNCIRPFLTAKQIA